MILMIDNYDSFTYNVVQYLGELKADVRVVRNDEITLDEMAALAPEKIVISPGPCTPNEAGISVAVIERFCRRNSYPRYLPGSSKYWAGFWWQGGTSQKSDAW